MGFKTLRTPHKKASAIEANIKLTQRNVAS